MTSQTHAVAGTEAQRLTAILESVVTGIITIDSHGRIETVNPAAERLFGYTAHEIIGRNVSILMPEPFRSQHDTYLGKYLATGQRKIIGIGREVVGLRKDGSTFPMHLSVGEFAIGGSRFFTGTIIDLSAQREVEHRLEREQALFHAIFASLPDPVVISDAIGTIRLVNPSFSTVFGYGEPEVLGESMGLLFETTGDWQRLAHDKPAASASAPLDTLRFRRKSGELFPAKIVRTPIVGHSGSPLGRLTLIHDSTGEQRQAELLLKAQRLEAVGQLTGGIAHDFNNLLTVILGNLELLEPKLEDALARSLASEAREAAEMGARLTDRLLTFARRQHLETRKINLSELVLGLTELLRRTIGTSIDLSTSLAANLLPTVADAGQIENAVLNLAINARDAMPEGGRLVIETFTAELDAVEVAAVPGLEAGEYVVLSVSDTGCGMTPEVKARAFEPFFTTKGSGRGSGLGLATIYGFVRQSGGNVTIYSEAGKGTTVNLYLPRAAPQSDVEKAAAARPAAVSGQGETVLLVEDDDRVRRLTTARLQQLGYQVLEAANGAAALKLLSETPHIEILFSDLVMPGGMSGLDLARLVRERYPAIPVVLTSGYSAELMNREQVAGFDLRVLRKPYRQAELARALREALNRAAS